jgi:hypothetical protein
MGTTKEPQYFCKDLNSQYFHLSGLERNDSNYLALFEHCNRHKIVGEGSTAYLYSSIAAEEIARFNPHAKIIAMFREPAEFLYSYHLQLLRNSCTFEIETDFDVALKLEALRKSGEQVPSSCFDRKFLFYSDRVRYTEQLDRFYSAFPSEQIKVIIYDDFQANNREVYLDVLRFLDLSSDYIPDMNIVNATVKVRSRKVKQTLDRVLFPIKQKLRVRITKETYQNIRNLYRKLVFSRGTVAPLDPHLKKELKKTYRDEVEKLGRFLNRDLISLWGYK